MRRYSLLAHTTGRSLLLAALLTLSACGNSSDDGESGTFLAVTYNVAGLPLPGVITGEDPAANAPLISPLLNTYDLVLLQEDWGDPLAFLEEAGVVPAGTQPGILGFHHLVVAEADHPYRSEPAPFPLLDLGLRRGLDGVLGPTLLGDGLNRLSRSPFGPLERIMWRQCNGSILVTPLEELLDVLLDNVPGLDSLLAPLNLTGDEGLIDDGSTDCAALKGFSVATHEMAPGVFVDVYNLHGDAGGNDRDIDVRVDNFEQLADFLLTHSEGRAVVLGGDTNLSFESDRRPRQRDTDGSTWARFQARTGLVDVCAVLACGDQDELRAQGFKNIDRFAYRSGGGVELRPLDHRFERERFTREDGEQMSDHDPVVVTFQWRRLP
ncbi:endonuclease/exonuclease/phosphatase family protein [Sinimarinibacterium flocculans]|jgi:hypothetical protein|uniref:Endonuclease/exonuclease/phosphatase family protein n=1 Tax=Sinimarinibacterium flocculans TaxID=985250 RepID=A0A318E5S0_9GAMM|nr:hypothetical protein [Sinimarinibacterium flocculans]PXV64269.1 hypothetical protein C8D93_11363 [Sinimarinibacterium flocculans]